MSQVAAVTPFAMAPVVACCTGRFIVLVCGTEPRAPCRVLVTALRIMSVPPSFQNFFGAMSTVAAPERPCLSVHVPW